jgi:Rhodopirellula transposase DDE domain
MMAENGTPGRAAGIRVFHASPGTSEWNEIEDRMFNHPTESWHGRPVAMVAPDGVAGTSGPGDAGA